MHGAVLCSCDKWWGKAWIIKSQMMNGEQLGPLTAKDANPSQGPGVLGEKAEGTLIEALFVAKAQCCLGTELVLTGVG